jgi:hypothetical protein
MALSLESLIASGANISLTYTSTATTGGEFSSGSIGTGSGWRYTGTTVTGTSNTVVLTGDTGNSDGSRITNETAIDLATIDGFEVRFKISDVDSAIYAFYIADEVFNGEMGRLRISSGTAQVIQGNSVETKSTTTFAADTWYQVRMHHVAKMVGTALVEVKGGVYSDWTFIGPSNNLNGGGVTESAGRFIASVFSNAGSHGETMTIDYIRTLSVTGSTITQAADTQAQKTFIQRLERKFKSIVKIGD